MSDAQPGSHLFQLGVIQWVKSRISPAPHHLFIVDMVITRLVFCRTLPTLWGGFVQRWRLPNVGSPIPAMVSQD